MLTLLSIFCDLLSPLSSSPPPPAPPDAGGGCPIGGVILGIFCCLPPNSHDIVTVLFVCQKVRKTILCLLNMCYRRSAAICRLSEESRALKYRALPSLPFTCSLLLASTDKVFFLLNANKTLFD